MTELAWAPASVWWAGDGQPLGNLALVRRLLEYIKPLGKPVALWPCDGQLAGNGAMREGSYSVRFCPLYPRSQTAALAALFGGSHWHPSSYHARFHRSQCQLIQDAKARGLHYCQYALDAFAT